jgi:hypothetical protein
MRKCCRGWNLRSITAATISGWLIRIGDFNLKAMLSRGAEFDFETGYCGVYLSLMYTHGLLKVNPLTCGTRRARDVTMTRELDKEINHQRGTIRIF